MITNEELTKIYNDANGITGGKNPPITTERIFKAMRFICEESNNELRLLQEVNDELLDVLNTINNWLVCYAIASAEDMASAIPEMQIMVSSTIDKATKEQKC